MNRKVVRAAARMVSSQAMVVATLLLTPVNALAQLNVPFKAQVPPGDIVDGKWPFTRNCGQTSVLMVAAFYDHPAMPPTQDDIKAVDDWLLQRFGDPINNYNGSYTNTSKLATLAIEYGGFNNSSTYENWTLDDLRNELNAGHPVIVEVWTNMRVGEKEVPHFMVLIGMDADLVYVHDPGHTAGATNRYKISTFQPVWETQHSRAVVIRPRVTCPPNSCCLRSANGGRAAAGSETICDDGIDNDCNGATDCADANCAGRVCRTSTAACDPEEVCTSGVCPADVNNCAGCNPNGVREGSEQCDGSDLGGATCQSQMFGCGTLSCNSDCTFNTSGCADNQCSPFGVTRCLDANTQQTCANFASGCLGWSVSVFCPNGCVGNACAAACTNDCSATGQTRCLDASTQQTCGNYDADSCLDWGNNQNCSNGCSGGACIAGCTNDCSPSGQTRCLDASTRQTCGNCDADACLEWGGNTSCTQGCSGGGCNSCGGSGQTCCSGNTCNSGLVCSGGTCQGNGCPVGIDPGPGKSCLVVVPYGESIGAQSAPVVLATSPLQTTISVAAGVFTATAGVSGGSLIVSKTLIGSTPLGNFGVGMYVGSIGNGRTMVRFNCSPGDVFQCGAGTSAMSCSGGWQIFDFTNSDANMSCGFGKQSGTSYVDAVVRTN